MPRNILPFQVKGKLCLLASKAESIFSAHQQVLEPQDILTNNMIQYRKEIKNQFLIRVPQNNGVKTIKKYH